MTNQTREALDRLMDDVPVRPAPIDVLLTAGRTAKRRKRLRVIGAVATTALAVGGGALSTTWLGSGQTDPDGTVVADGNSGPPEAPGRVQRLDQMPSGTRPDCRDGGVTRIIPGHSGWDSLTQAAVGLLRHPGADHAAMSPANGRRATIVLYRSDDTIKAAARLRRLDDRWFPDSIAVCQSTVR